MVKKTIDEIFEFVRNGATIKQGMGKSGYPITRIETIWNEEIDNERFGYADIGDDELNRYEKYLMKKGDILMTHINSPKHLGKCAIYDGFPSKLIHGMNLLCMRARKEVSDPKYLKYFLNSMFFKTQLSKISNQSVNQASFSAGNLKKLKISLPPLDQQKKIAAILDAADAYRQKTKALIEKYNELTQSLFLDMFEDHFNFDKKPLKELVKFSQGQQFGVELQLLEPQDGYARFLRIVDFTQGDDFRYVPNQDEKYHVKSDDIVIVRYGASAGFVGTNKEGVLANNLFKVNYDRAIFHQLFLYHIFQHGRFIAFIEKEAFGAAMPAISFKVMERFEIPVPPIDLQTQFAERVQAIEEQKAQAEASLAQAEDLFNSLLQRAFKGKLTEKKCWDERI